MEIKSRTSSSQDQCTSPSLSTVKFLKQKRYEQSFRKTSIESETDRRNFCLNFSSSEYTVMRVYIDAIVSKQIRLYYTKFTPKIKKGQICIIHGYGQSSDDYLQMAQYYAIRGYVVNMVDLRGFGYSGGSRVNEPTNKVLSDIQTLLRNCCQRDLPIFIIAHGLGAMFLNALLQQNSCLPISGVINITPLVNFVSSNRSLVLQRILLLISPSIFSNLLVHNMVNPTALAKDPYAIKAKIQSVFWQSFITLQMAHQYELVGEKIRAEGYKFTYPTLFCCGQLDLIQDLSQIKSYYNSLSSQDKQMKIFKDGYHQLQNDYQSSQLFDKIYRWMELRRGKVKWVPMKPFQKKNIYKKDRLWLKIGLIGIIILILGLIKKFSKCVTKLNSF